MRLSRLHGPARRAGRPESRGAPPGPPPVVSPSETAAIVFQAASVLLAYPEDGDGDVALVSAAVQELASGEIRDRLNRFLMWWERMATRDRQAVYVQTFELGALASLYLTSRHSRDKYHRGQELLRIRDVYRRHGLIADRCELPDYLPVVLEFAAAVPEGARILRDEQEALHGLRATLKAAGSPFAEVVSAVLLAARDQVDGRGRPR